MSKLGAIITERGIWCGFVSRIN